MTKNQLSEKKFELEINPLAMEKLKRTFESYPEVISLLEKTLQEKEETLVNYVQINGDHLHNAILEKGPTYWYGIWVQDKKGDISKLIRVCDYIGFGDVVRGGIKAISIEKK